MFKEIKSVKSILWCQRFGGFNNVGDQFIPPSLGARIHSMKAVSRESIIEQILCIKPDLLIFEADTAGDKAWSQLILFIRAKVPKTGFLAILEENSTHLIEDLAGVQVDGLVKQERIHLELPIALKAYQRGETYLSSQVTKTLCSLIKTPNTNTYELPNKGLLNSLTNRETEVLACLTKGLNYKAIAKHLFVSDSTVKTHVNNIFTKLNVNDRTQAVLYGLKHGMAQIAEQMFSLPPN